MGQRDKVDLALSQCQRAMHSLHMSKPYFARSEIIEAIAHLSAYQEADTTMAGMEDELLRLLVMSAAAGRSPTEIIADADPVIRQRVADALVRHVPTTNEPGSLLAVIHGDGGHHAEEHGMAKACADAEAVVVGLRSDTANMSSALNKSIQALGLERRARADLEAEAIDLRAELDAQKKRFDPRCAQAVDCTNCGD